MSRNWGKHINNYYLKNNVEMCKYVFGFLMFVISEAMTC